MTAYFQCLSGISGDMTVAALLDLGAKEEVLRKGLESLSLEGYDIKIGRVEKCGISACDFQVILEEEHSHGSMEVHHHHGHSHEEIGAHHHHGHSHEEIGTHHHHGHVHRTLTDIIPIIENSGITEKAKTLSKKIFYIVAEAEGKAHGLPMEKVHFHEVGAIDSIVDIVGAAICLDNLGIAEAVFSPIAEGCGHVHCQHGNLPVPVPAVLYIAEKYQLPLQFTETEGEMVTPTGIAIAAALYQGKQIPKTYRILKTGIGAGKKLFPHANLLRIFLLEEATEAQGMFCLETNIDDCSGECLGFVLEKLLQAGAKDAFCTPIFMKKGRPAYLLSVLCEANEIETMEEILFLHTTTIGIRRYAIERTCLERTQKTIQTPYGEGIVKKVVYGEHVFYYPEYESVKELAEQNGLSFSEAEQTILFFAKKNHGK